MSLRRRLGALLRRGRVALWYHQDYALPSLAFTSRVDHIEIDRGERIIARLLQENLVKPVDVRTSPMASLGQLRGFHSLDWLEKAEDSAVLGRIFGLEASQVDVENLLDCSRRGVGGTIAAAHEAAAGRVDVAINLGGGFHHAEPELGSGFCVFNDIGVAISDLRRSGYQGRVAIVDLDFHQGNGNSVAYAADPDVFVYSIHGAVWSHGESGGKEIYLSGGVNDRRYMAQLRTTLETELSRFKPDLVFYIAGADVLAGDRLGAFWLTPKGVFDRDRHVYEVARSLDAPLVVTLGGGYSRQAWLAHFYFARALLTGLWHFDKRSSPTLRARYTRIASELTQSELQGESLGDIVFTEEDIFGALGPHPVVHRFLGFYSVHGMELAFERYGLLEELRGRGFVLEPIEIDPSDPMRQLIRVSGQRPPMAEPHTLVELVLRRRLTQSTVDAVGRFEALFIEWMLLQDPSRDFTLARPRLPGQDHPGLGLSQALQELLLQSCQRLELDALQDRPSHFHMAMLTAREWYFLDPLVEGRFRALRIALQSHEMYEATRLVHVGRMVLGSGEVVQWIPGDHVRPVSSKLMEYFASEAYLDLVDAEMERLLGAGLRVATSNDTGSFPIGAVRGRHAYS